MAKSMTEKMTGSKGELKMLAIADIVNIGDCRTKAGSGGKVDPDLVASVAANGILNPVSCFYDRKHKAYALLDGRGRYAAAKAVGLTSIPAYVRENVSSEADFFRLALEANVARRDLTRSEVLAAMKRLEGHEDAKRLETLCGISASTQRLYKQIEKALTAGGFDKESVSAMIDYLPMRRLRAVAQTLAATPEAGKAAVKEVKEVKNTARDAKAKGDTTGSKKGKREQNGSGAAPRKAAEKAADAIVKSGQAKTGKVAPSATSKVRSEAAIRQRRETVVAQISKASKAKNEKALLVLNSRLNELNWVLGG